MSEPANSEYLLPSAKEKRMAMIMIVVLSIVGAILLWMLWRWSGFIAQLIQTSQFEEARRQSRYVVGFVFATMSCSLLALSALIGDQNWRARTEQRYPHTGAKVFRKTLVLSGAAAVRKANFGLLASLGLLALGLISAFWTYSEISR